MGAVDSGASSNSDSGGSTGGSTEDVGASVMSDVTSSSEFSMDDILSVMQRPVGLTQVTCRALCHSLYPIEGILHAERHLGERLRA